MPSVVCRRGRSLAVAALLVSGFPLWAVDPKPNDPAAVIERLKKDLFYLAGPELAGRASGGKEIEKAADYVAAAFKETGLKPGGKDGSYFQPFPVYGPSALSTPVYLNLSGPEGQGLNLKPRSQFSLTEFSGTGKAKAGLVFVGYGITSSKPAYDDYKGVDAKGKVVVILRRSPKYTEGAKNPFGVDGGEGALLRTKLRN